MKEKESLNRTNCCLAIRNLWRRLQIISMQILWKISIKTLSFAGCLFTYCFKETFTFLKKVIY